MIGYGRKMEGRGLNRGLYMRQEDGTKQCINVQVINLQHRLTV